jgi:hypothetical protein
LGIPAGAGMVCLKGRGRTGWQSSFHYSSICIATKIASFRPCFQKNHYAKTTTRELFKIENQDVVISRQKFGYSSQGRNADQLRLSGLELINKFKS